MSQENIANIIDELTRTIANLIHRFDIIKATLQLDEKRKKRAELQAEVEGEAFWNNPVRAGVVQKEKTKLEKELERIEKLSSNLHDLQELVDMVSDEQESDVLTLQQEIAHAEKDVHQLEMERMLGGDNDACNAILNINAGQGGVDSQDFAEMLLRMYKRYAERRGFDVEVLDIQHGEEAGIKGVTALVKGEYAYGYLKAEVGVHRLVRISPFDSNARRHTSFASVWVIPEIDDDIAVDIKAEDLRIDTYRAGGAGGQHVNKTDSAVRITHIPTNIAVACQSERSQIQNRVTAMKLLRAKLYDIEMKKRLADRDKAEAAKMEASFGSQIRNYVLAPYRIAKDLRSGYEVGNVDAVLDGDIQPFIEAYLLYLQQSKSV